MNGTVLVLGGTGFIGRSWMASLAGHRHVGKNLKIAQLANRDFGDEHFVQDLHEAMKRIKPDVVLQLAWAACGTPRYEHSKSNLLWIQFSEQIALASQDHGAWFVGIGTGVEVIRSNTSIYAESKRKTFEQLSRLLGNDGFTWLRPHWIFDVAARRPRVLKDALAAQRKSRKFEPKTPSDFHDFIDIQDVNAAISIAVMQRLPGVHDIATGQSRTVWRFLKACGIALEPYPVEFLEFDQTRRTFPVPRNEFLHVAGWEPRRTEAFFAM